MSIYRIVDRLVLVLALALSIGFLLINQPATAIVALALWPLTRAVISVLDVFFLFFTEKPLVRGAVYQPSVGVRGQHAAE